MEQQPTQIKVPHAKPDDSLLRVLVPGFITFAVVIGILLAISNGADEPSPSVALRPRAEVDAARKAQLAANPQLAAPTPAPFNPVFVSGSFSWEILDVRWFDSYIPAHGGGSVDLYGNYKSCLAIYYRIKNLGSADRNAYAPIPQAVKNAWPSCAEAEIRSVRDLDCGPIPVAAGATIEGVKVLKVGFHKTDILLTPCDDRGELDKSQTIRVPWDDRWSKVHLIPNFGPQNVNATDQE